MKQRGEAPHRPTDPHTQPCPDTDESTGHITRTNSQHSHTHLHKLARSCMYSTQDLPSPLLRQSGFCATQVLASLARIAPPAPDPMVATHKRAHAGCHKKGRWRRNWRQAQPGMRVEASTTGRKGGPNSQSSPPYKKEKKRKEKKKSRKRRFHRLANKPPLRSDLCGTQLGPRLPSVREDHSRSRSKTMKQENSINERLRKAKGIKQGNKEIGCLFVIYTRPATI